MNAPSKRATQIGWFLTGFVGLFLTFDGTIHILNIEPVVKAFEQLGYSDALAVPLGVIELVCLALYLIPRTSVLGAILLTGYLGGAVATNVRVSAPLFSTELFPVYVGVMLWGALWLRNPTLRALMPVRKESH